MIMGGLEDLPRKTTMIRAKGILDFTKGASQSIAPSPIFQDISLLQIEILAIIIDLICPLRIQDNYYFLLQIYFYEIS